MPSCCIVFTDKMCSDKSCCCQKSKPILQSKLIYILFFLRNRQLKQPIVN